LDLLQTLAEHCPWCGEPIELSVDCSYGAHVYVEDCAICCAPIEVHVTFAPDERAPQLMLIREND
jgi:hypothetical protein